MIVVGVDPGGRWTGVVIVEAVRHRSPVYLGSTTIESPGSILPVHDHYLRAIALWIKDQGLRPRGRCGLLAVEAVRKPNAYHKGAVKLTNPEPILATAYVAGFVHSLAIRWGFDFVEVPAGGNGGGPLGTYPVELASVHEQKQPGWEQRPGSPGGKLRHERSAFDVARRGAQMMEGK